MAEDRRIGGTSRWSVIGIKIAPTIMTSLPKIRMIALFLALFVLVPILLKIPPVRADQTVNLDLVLAIDASGTVDPAEFELQTRGLAEAFRHPEVIAAIQATGARGIAVAVVQWSGRGQQVVTIDWTPVADEASSKALANRIEVTGRRLVGATTVIDRALLFSVALLANSPFHGQRKVIDLSGDGKTNYGPLPDLARDQALAAGITINGLAILNDVADLAEYYQDHVVGGVGSFLMTARDYRDFATAIRLKLVREILGTPVAAWPRTPVRVTKHALASQGQTSRRAPIQKKADEIVGHGPGLLQFDVHTTPTLTLLALRE